mmetsp:Transcript_104386/g.225224  ORF Transcript_104386/g.225224 Transcript_104386/m.225224 type:complete len:214 (+) Transcript_104386:102-743(+)
MPCAASPSRLAPPPSQILRRPGGAPPPLLVASPVFATGAGAGATTAAGCLLQVSPSPLELLLHAVRLLLLLLQVFLLLVDELLGDAYGAVLRRKEDLPELGAEGRGLPLHEARQVHLKHLRVQALVRDLRELDDAELHQHFILEAHHLRHALRDPRLHDVHGDLLHIDLLGVVRGEGALLAQRLDDLLLRVDMLDLVGIRAAEEAGHCALKAK